MTARESPVPNETGKRAWWQVWADNVGTLVFTGLAAGISTGVVFGEYCSFLSVFGDAFVGLLRMTVLPLIATTLVANLGRQSLQATRRLAAIGGCVLLVLWALTLAAVYLLPTALPPSESASFYSSALVDPATGENLLPEFIPSNVFEALANNDVPAVIVFCVCMGAALATVPQRHEVIALLDVATAALLRVAGFIAKLAPLGVFAIAASTTGTLRLEEVGRLQAYLLIYCLGGLFFTFVALPCLVASVTPIGYRQVLKIVRDPMITAFATGKLIIVLPMLIENTERFLEQQRNNETGKHDVEVLYTTAYAFPHAGKLLTMVFIPFSAWFFGDQVSWSEYPSFLVLGVAAYFGGPVIAIPYLLDKMHLPHDMFQLFLLTGVIGEPVGDAVGVMHLATFSLLTLAAIQGWIRLSFLAVAKYLALVVILGAVALHAAANVLSRTAASVKSKSEVLAAMQLIEEPADAVVLTTPSPNPVPRKPGETLIERIRRRGIMRIGYNEDKLPFAYFNESGNLVGFDVNLAHALARDLGVSAEFVRFDRATVAEQLRQDHFDLVMSGLVGTLERSEAMQHSDSYMDVHLGLVVPDYRVREFKSLRSIREIGSVKIGFVDLSRGFVSRLMRELPDAQLVEITDNRDFFEQSDLYLDALLISAESGSAFTLLYPEYEVAIPQDLDVKLPLIYAIAGNDSETRSFLNHWVELRTKDGTFDDYYRYWILGQTRTAKQPRWSIIRDVAGWGD